MELHNLTNTPGARSRRKRVGRGCGSGMGKTSTRGHKGAGARKGHKHKLTFEGGQMPLVRRLPKRGFNNARFNAKALAVNVSDLEKKFEAGAEVTVETLAKAGFSDNKRPKIKILGNGELETLVTTLPRDRFPPEVLRDLYHTRWRIENGFRVLKWQNHLAQMHCRIDGLSRQETWLKLASHNLVSAAVAAAEALHPHVDAPGAKYDTVPDRHHATVCVTSFLLSPHSRWDPPADGRECVTRSIASHRTQLRTGRTSPRRKRAIGHAPSHYRC